MKQVIPFSKEIVFKTVIASITSISLEHEEKVYDSEVSGDFIIFGDYKIHNDTTEKELFKYRLPFTAILPEEAVKDSIKIDIEDFTYDQVEEDVIKVNIDFSISYEEKVIDETLNSEKEREDLNNNLDDEVIDGTNKIDEETIKEIEEFLRNKEDKKEEQDEMIEENLEKEKDDETIEEDKCEEERKMINIEDETKEEEAKEEIKEATKEEYVIYHIHIVKENETIEQIISHYETSIETVKLYNEIDKIKTGDKLIIPEYIDD